MPPKSRRWSVALAALLASLSLAALTVAFFDPHREVPSRPGSTEGVGARAFAEATRPVARPPAKRGLASRGDFPLTQATSPAEVQAVVQYAREATEAEIPALRRVALSSEDPLVAGNAIAALGRLKQVSRDDALVRLLHDPRLRARQEVVAALGQSGDRSSVDLLARALEDHDDAVRPLVIQALGRLGGEHARRMVRGILADSRSTAVDRAFAGEAMRAMATP